MTTQTPRTVPAMPGRAGAGHSDESRVLLRDGSAIAIRPLTTGDVVAIAAWFEGLGPETRYARFLAGVTTLDDRTRWQLAQVDHRDHEALTAVAPGGAVVGIARYIRLPQASTAEVAVAVADHWRGRESLACSCSRSQRGLARLASIAWSRYVSRRTLRFFAC